MFSWLHVITIQLWSVLVLQWSQLCGCRSHLQYIVHRVYQCASPKSWGYSALYQQLLSCCMWTHCLSWLPLDPHASLIWSFLQVLLIDVGHHSLFHFLYRLFQILYHICRQVPWWTWFELGLGSVWNCSGWIYFSGMNKKISAHNLAESVDRMTVVSETLVTMDRTWRLLLVCDALVET